MIEELERLARAASPDHIYTHPRDHNNWKANEEYIAALSPDRVLRLLEVVKQAKLVADGIAGEGWLRSQELRGERMAALRAALAGLEEEQK